MALLSTKDNQFPVPWTIICAGMSTLTMCRKVSLAKLQPLDEPVTISTDRSKELCTYPLSYPILSIAQWSGATAGQPFRADWNV